LTLQLTPRRAAILLLAAVLAGLYFFNLSGMGLISTDEPRYADIGRAMARTGDLITPRLSGQPWFEKPPLLYWLIAAGFKLGLGPETAPRLPIALLSAAFLIFYFDRLRRLWDVRIACLSTALLATSAAWVALSGIAITDIPLAVFFSAAVLFALDAPTRRNRTLAAAALGLAVLAKSLVAPVLFLPVLALNYKRLGEWLRPAPIATFLAIALPWYILCYLKNGAQFLYILFIQQQFGRFATAERQHGQPWWFYAPALLLALYPWFPLLLTAPRQWSDRRIRTLLSVVLFGFLFFSASLNKLPTYLTPLVPSACILMGAGLSRLRKPEWAMVLPVALLGLVPIANRALPTAMATGIHAVALPWPSILLWCAACAAAASLLAISLKQKAVYAAFLAVALAFFWLKAEAFPALDAAATARPLWLTRHPACADPVQRALAYGLNYYSGRLLPPCPLLDRTPARVVR
jgi:4-amino-4-deoxy-L-arabinose transferase-like glycosyltransferase